MVVINGYYSGVGSRKTPAHVCKYMAHIASALEIDGYVLRSGGADGADLAFEAGVMDPANKEIYLPWRDFNGSTSELFKSDKRARAIAKSVIPHWDVLSYAGQCLHTRNVHQVFGKDLETPSDFLVCWTTDGKVSGGTATAIKLAQHNNIPCINLADYPDHLEMERAFDSFLMLIV